jgi:hypothetical protein
MLLVGAGPASHAAGVRSALFLTVCGSAVLGLISACEDADPLHEPAAGGGGAVSQAAGEGGAAAQSGDAAGQGGGPPEPMSYCSGTFPYSTPAPPRALPGCDAEEPCVRSLAQVPEGQDSEYIGEEILCLLSALAERRPGRYSHETDASTTGAANTSALHTLVVHDDGTVSYVSEPYRCVRSIEPMGDVSSVGPLGCTLKPPSYFEACIAAIEEAIDPRNPSLDRAEAWACAFGDGDIYTPSNLFWFESCANELPPRCD